MRLARHTRANREFFEKGDAPSIHDWVEWIKSGCVKGKIINGRPWVDLNYFAVNDVMDPLPETKPSGHMLLD